MRVTQLRKADSLVTVLASKNEAIYTPRVSADYTSNAETPNNVNKALGNYTRTPPCPLNVNNKTLGNYTRTQASTPSPKQPAITLECKNVPKTQTKKPSNYTRTQTRPYKCT